VPLLCAMEGARGTRCPARAHRPARGRGPALHRFRGHLLGRAITAGGECENAESPAEVPRAVAAAMSIASALGLTVDDAVVLQNSNKLTVRLLPCDVLARIAP